MELAAPAQRVLGALIEKARATPQQYPLTITALRSACNQRTGREPVVDWDEPTVRSGLDELKAAQLVKLDYARGSRTPRYAHRAGEQLDLDPAQEAVLALLLLRGPQTVGELRARSERLHGFASLAEVEDTLASLEHHRLLPLAGGLPRQPGQKEARFMHLLGPRHESPTADDEGGAYPSPDAADAALRDEVASLRAEVAELRAALAQLGRRVDALGGVPGLP